MASRGGGPVYQINFKYFERRNDLLWGHSDTGDADPRVEETRDTLRHLNQLRHDWARKVGRAIGAEQQRLLTAGLTALDELKFAGAPETVTARVSSWTWGRTAASELRIRFDNPADTISERGGLGYIFPELIAHPPSWAVTCEAPAANPTYGALEFIIKAKPASVAGLLLGAARTETIRIKARNYAGPTEITVNISGLGVQPSE